jgi:hypothetical protein
MSAPGGQVKISTPMYKFVVLLNDTPRGVDAWFAQVEVKSPISQHSTVRPVSVLRKAVTRDFWGREPSSKGTVDISLVSIAGRIES